jgi:hypothetical protein
MPKEVFSESRWQAIELRWGDRNTQIGVTYDETQVFASLSLHDIDRFIKALKRAKKARSRDYHEE